MRTIFLYFILLLSVSSSNAQLNKPTASSVFNEMLSRVTNDFRNNFYRIQGAMISSEPAMDTYRSAIAFPGASKCLIMRFHSEIDTTASWQAIMYEGDNYIEAVRSYRSTCNQIEKSKLQLYNMPEAKFIGKMDQPDANVRFTNSIFKLKSKDEAYASFFAEVELINTNFDQWEVHVNLHNRKDDQDE